MILSTGSLVAIKALRTLTMALPSGIVGRTSAAFALLLLAAPVSASQRESERKLPSNHPDVVYSKFGGHLNCPYAKDWMSKGPEAAAQDLGVLPPGAGKTMNAIVSLCRPMCVLSG